MDRTLIFTIWIFTFFAADIQADASVLEIVNNISAPLTVGDNSESSSSENNSPLEQGPPTSKTQGDIKQNSNKKQQDLIDAAIDDFKVTNEKGETVICSKEDTLAVTIDGKVNYRCRTKEKALGEDEDTQQGEGETNQLIDTLFIDSKQTDTKEIKLNSAQIKTISEINAKKTNQNLSSSKKKIEPTRDSKTNIISNETETIIIKQHSDGDLKIKDANISTESPNVKEEKIAPKNQLNTSDEIILIAKESPPPINHSIAWIQNIPIKAYLRLRATYRSKNEEDKLNFSSSRMGFIYAKKLDNEDHLIFHVEAGIDAFNQLLDTSAGNEVSSNKIRKRLLYFRYGREDYYVVIGKNWSVYHYIASMAYEFNSLGGKTTGIFNAGSDGGSTGTGRASDALQLRSSKGIFQWGTQLQSNTEISTFGSKELYSLNAALMGKLKFLNGFGIGASYLKSVPNGITTNMIAQGFDGDTTASVIGAEWKISDWDFSATVAKNKNLVTDNQMQYYDATGTELYATTRFTPLTQFRLGFSYQKPNDKENYQGKHKISEAYIGWQYSYNKNNFSDRIFIEYALNNGRYADGTDGTDILNFGIRYNFQN